MQTILSTVSLLCSVGCFLLNLFVYFELEDLKTGAVSSHDTVREVNKVIVPQVVVVEFALHWLVGAVAAVRWDWAVVVATLPLSLYSLAQLVSRTVYFDPLTVLHFHEKQKKATAVRAKAVYYGLLALWHLYAYQPLSFARAFSSAVVYNIFGSKVSVYGG